MHIFSLLITTLLSTYATDSCPKIEGRFNCISQGEILEIKIDYKKTADTTIYVINQDPVIADGRSRFYENENVKNGKISGTCVDNKLQHHLKGEFINSKNEPYGRVNLISVFKPNKSKGLEIIQSGEYFFDEYGEIPIDNVIICVRPES